jgi:hypothetical protein
MEIFRPVAILVAFGGLGTLAPVGKAQSTVASSDAASNANAAVPSTASHPQPVFVYSRPTEKMKLRTYLFDAFGPYPIVGAAFIAGVNQAERTPQ